MNNVQENGAWLAVATTKPDGKPAAMLAQMGIVIRPIEDDEGDVDRYIISERLVVERRTSSRFLRGIMDKTLFTGAIFIREHFEIPILIVEGEINYEHTMFNPQAVRGALSSMILQYGISVLTTADVEETVALIAMIARQEQVGIPEISLIPKRKATDLADMQRRVIEMLPGCGMVMARNLLQHFGSVKRITNASETELRSIPGIGRKKAADMIRVLNAEYASVDTEKNLEDAIEADPCLLFEQPVTLLARQHFIFGDQRERHIVDLVFLDEAAAELILVELKRGKLVAEHEAQLKRYLDRADASPLLAAYLADGVHVHGILATVQACTFTPRDRRITVRIADRKQVIDVLKRLRRQHLAR